MSPPFLFPSVARSWQSALAALHPGPESENQRTDLVCLRHRSRNYEGSYTDWQKHEEGNPNKDD